MKKIYFLPFLSLLVSCGSDIGFKQPDKRAATQLALIKEFSVADSIYQAQPNDVAKKESFEKSRTSLSNFIDSTLKGKVDNWEVIITDITPGIDGIDATFVMSKQSDSEEPTYEGFQTLTFDCRNIKGAALEQVLKTLEPNDKVLISGNFGEGRDPRGIRNFQTIYHVTIDDEDQFQKPSFNFNLTGIKKKPEEKL